MADVVLVGLDQAFVDIALVQLRIAHQRDHAARLVPLPQAVGDKIVLHQAGEGGDGDAKPDRAGGEIDRNPVLGPARIALPPLKDAKRLKLLAALAAHRSAEHTSKLQTLMRLSYSA